MKNLKLLSFVLVLAFASFASAQTILTTTTLSAAIGASVSSALTTGNLQIITVASATGISAPSPNTSNTYGIATSEAQTYLYVDRELMEVRSVSGTAIGVIRATNSTAGASHASGALVFIIPAVAVQSGTNARLGGIPQGSCTRTSELYLPHIQFVSGTISDCVGGQWINGDAAQSTRLLTPVLVPNPGGTLLTAIDTAGTAPGAATEQYCTQIYLPYSKLVTGLGLLNGTTVGTDKHLVILYDATGNLLANSAVAGALSATASVYQRYAFTTPYYAVGPAVYFGCFQSNGTTDTVRRVDTAANQDLFAGKLTGQVFGTIPNPITVPSSFTTALGPNLEFY